MARDFSGPGTGGGAGSEPCVVLRRAQRRLSRLEALVGASGAPKKLWMSKRKSCVVPHCR